MKIFSNRKSKHKNTRETILGLNIFVTKSYVNFRLFNYLRIFLATITRLPRTTRKAINATMRSKSGTLACVLVRRMGSARGCLTVLSGMGA